MSEAPTGWYVVQTQPHMENKATNHLVRQGYLTYVPRYLKKRRHARRVETIAAPLFPRYLFVAVDRLSQGWRCIKSTVGVSHLICNGDTAAVVRPEIVAELRAREDERGFVMLDRRVQFTPGDKIQVAHGALSSCFGSFEGLADQERVAILLDLLGRKVRVFLEAETIVAA